MHFSKKILPCFLLLNSRYSEATPTPIAQGGAIANPCVISGGDSVSYTKTSEQEVKGDPEQLSGSCIPNEPGAEGMLFCLDQEDLRGVVDNAKVTLGCSTAHSATYSVGVTVTVGGDLGLSEIGEIKSLGVSLGVSASVAFTTTTGKADTTSTNCNGPWSCGLLMFPTLLEVSGVKTTHHNTCEGGSSDEPYTVRLPILIESTPKASFQACACKNYPSATDPGAPPLCPDIC